MFCFSPNKFQKRNREKGFSLLELVITMSILTILMSMAVFNFHDLEQPATNGASELMGFLKKTRAKALATTLAYTAKPNDNSQVITTYGTTCSAAQQVDTSLTLTLPNHAHLTDTEWMVCYSTRGLANSSIDIAISGSDGTKVVQVVLGGAIRIL